jgi:hypothetical protein
MEIGAQADQILRLHDRLPTPNFLGHRARARGLREARLARHAADGGHQRAGRHLRERGVQIVRAPDHGLGGAAGDPRGFHGLGVVDALAAVVLPRTKLNPPPLSA